MNRATRVLVVTGGLLLTGAVAGAVIGAVVLLGYAVVSDGPRGVAPVGPLVAIGGAAGAGIGAVLAPVLAWGLLRDVPLGRAVAETAAGTLAGALAGGLLPAVGPIIGGIVGFTAAGVRLRVVYARAARRQRLDCAG